MGTALYLAWSVLAAVFAGAAWFPARRGPLVPVYFFGAWIAGELALQFAVLHVLVTIAFASAGVLASGVGVFALALNLAACGALIACHLRSIDARDEVVALAAKQNWTLDTRIKSAHGFARPFHMKRPGVRRISNLEYGEALPRDKGGRNRIDVVLPEASGERRPVLLQIHGGGWMIGSKEQQGGPLMGYLAQHGWVCFAMNYRLSPKAVFPDHIVDVKRAIAWIREHADEYGADPEFICVTGGSAGGHLAALAALTPNDPAFQPGFESAETGVAAAVPFYGVYDFLDRSGQRGSASMQPFLAKNMFQCQPDENPELWSAMSPIERVGAGAPPFLVIQGSHDSLVWADEAREFADALREKSQSPVHYLEFLGGQHAFDTFHSVRSAYAVRAAAAFLASVRSETQP